MEEDDEGVVKRTMPPTEDPTGQSEEEKKMPAVRWGLIQRNNSKDSVLFVCNPGRTDLREGTSVIFKSTVGRIQGQEVEMATEIKVK